MIVIQQLRLPLEHTKEDIERKLCKILRIKASQILSWEIIRQSIDSRKKEIIFSYTIHVLCENERSLQKVVDGKNVMSIKEHTYQFPSCGKQVLPHRPVVVGSGPAGLFCAYYLAKAGYAPLILERGKCIEERKKDVAQFWENGLLNPESNVQFGEGGAGTFSDGKLNTLVKDKDGRNREVLRIFVEHGAPKDILYAAKPHIGTDVLETVIINLRRKIESFGGEFRFETKMEDLIIQNGAVNGVVLQDGTSIQAEAVVLALGHSARDSFQMLYGHALPMEAKAFAVGFRVEHPQEMIEKQQYHGCVHENLPAASYKVHKKTSTGRGVYSFCMCPGGYVVNASSEQQALAVNGMSYHSRDAKNANSAIIVSVTPEDFGGEGPLAGIEYQRRLERQAYFLGNGKIPQQLYGDFKRNCCSDSYGGLESCAKGNTQFTNLRGLFSDEINATFLEGMEFFDRQIPGFAREDAILSGVESRTSSPVRLLRNEQLESMMKGIYPCGEGAGYAGGITSAAMDGIKVAEVITRQYRNGRKLQNG